MGNLLWDGLFKLVFMNNLLPKGFCVDLKIYFVCIYEKMGKINSSVLDVIKCPTYMSWKPYEAVIYCEYYYYLVLVSKCIWQWYFMETKYIYKGLNWIIIGLCVI